ncbi:Uncharacterised protein [Bordetella ansorpii]|uniref:DUF1488 domain-containing protein n=1 Tax=Bordetella ansorpii TaxID=288768 RepID=A0A157RLZ0_9BORD|nr:hypothetical protein [Bordetella ansorpii]SAI58988.1 Uncharacterised protein [Bordetella ansorpii]
MRPAYVEVMVYIDGTAVVCEVSTRVLDHLADSDDLHSKADYHAIAAANFHLIEAAARTRPGPHITGMPLRLERAHFPAKL